MSEQEVGTKPTPVMRFVRGMLWASVALGLGALAACSEADPVELPADEQRTEMSSTVTAATWTDGPWPFTVEEGELRCLGPEEDPGVFLVTAAGDMFALNPAAIRMAGQVGATADLDPIWQWLDPEFATAKVNVSPMILYGLALC